MGQNHKNTKYVLSIDGGGIRGLIPAKIPAAIEDQVTKNVKKYVQDEITKNRDAKLPKVDDIDVRIADLFDLVAGTSTGAIIALGLTVTNEKKRPKFTANDIVDIYINNRKRFFQKKFGDKRITDDDIVKKDGTAIKVLAPSFNITTNKRAFFANYESVSEEYIQKGWSYTVKGALMREALRASTSAPAYFRSARLKLNEKPEEEYIDSGVFMNNPSVHAYSDAKFLFKNSEIVVVSLGTGFYKELPRNATTRWLFPIINLMMTEESITSSTYVQKLLDEDHYYRFTIKLEHAIDLDSVADADIKTLENTANEIMNNNRRDNFEKLVK
ncbi:6211_t:CDS:2, partial [Gigaspora rosea]